MKLSVHFFLDEKLIDIYDFLYDVTLTWCTQELK